MTIKGGRSASPQVDEHMRTLVIDLTEIARDDTSEAGGKAATLGELLQAGFPVPEGFLITTTAFRLALQLAGQGEAAAARSIRLPDEVDEAIRGALTGRENLEWAVRSSAVAEDLEGASYAGLYETVLGVVGYQAIREAVRACWVSTFSERVAVYDSEPATAMAVLIQRLVRPTAAGVAFSANPVTGVRDEVVINSVRGMGDRLVSGTADPDEWVVTGGHARRVRDPERSLTPEWALTIARLARELEERLGAPQDIEWAIADDELFLLQARPITALPDLVSWDFSMPGAWVRNFRLGEWIGEPMTPLFDTWLLPRIEQAFFDQYEEWFGFRLPPPHHVTVNGWYFGTLPMPRSPGMLMLTLARMLARLVRNPRRVSAAVPPLAGVGMDLFIRDWKEELLPSYTAIVRQTEAEVAHAEPEELVGLIERLAELAGRYYASLTIVAGYGWKTELPLAKFCREHLDSVIDEGHQVLLAGLYPIGATPPHAVQNLDWSRPTLGELGGGDTLGSESDSNVVAARRHAEAQAREALRSSRRLLARFEELLVRAQEAARMREEHVSHFTLAWPALRQAALRLGERLVEVESLEDAEQVFYVTFDELRSSVLELEPAEMGSVARGRSSQWKRQTRLSPPLVIGKMPSYLQKLFDQAEAARGGEVPEGAITGLPASPGRVTGIARVIRSIDDEGRLGAGEILVAPLTTPAWTPMFRRAAAVVTDVGSVISHASLVAREYGIPAVVGTGDGTSRIRDGEVVTVDGRGGFVDTRTLSAYISS
ncbi:MAG TPA: PEP/pyruvate-binding domain-containing protein [Acidimicrobiia bacterium]|nr:PEP/pyruvate-binding domain-containing protein [Acidimicrobiia bacterium]